MNKEYLLNITKDITGPMASDRRPRSQRHDLAKDYLVKELMKLNVKPINKGSYIQPIYDSDEKVLGENIVGILPGRGEKYILAIAHYDTLRSCPGADDNGAAIAVLLDTLRDLGQWRGECSLVVLLSDLEEPPHFQRETMGSTYFYNNCPVDREKIVCALVLDLVGHDVNAKNLRDALFVMGSEYSDSLMDVVEVSSQDLEDLRVYPAPNCLSGNMSDHHIFEINKRPFLFLSCGKNRHYHRPTDTIENLNFDKMSTIAQFLKNLILSLDQNPPPFYLDRDLDYSPQNLGPYSPRGRFCPRFLSHASQAYGGLLCRYIRPDEKDVIYGSWEIMQGIEG